MKIVLAQFRSSKDKWLELFEKKYIRKINYLFPFECHSFKSKPFPREQKERKIQDEFKQLSRFIHHDDQVIFFDERGKTFQDSYEFSQFLVQNIELGKRRTLFVIGGAYGFSREAYLLAHHKVRLSNLTISHTITIASATEQIYRGLSIWKGLPYHNE